MKLLFDCDGTILDSMHIWVEPMKNLLQKYNYSFSKEEKGRMEALDKSSMCKWICDNIATDMTLEEVNNHFDTIINNAYHNTLMPKEGASQIIRKLKDEGFKMAVASSTDISLLESALKRLELLDCFEFIITPDSSPFNKGNREFWELSCQKLNENPKNVILFDDALYAVKAAGNIGIKTCGIKDFPYNQKEWDYIVENSDFVLDGIKDIDIEMLR